MKTSAVALLLLLFAAAPARSAGSGASRTDPRGGPCGKRTGSARADCLKGASTSGEAAAKPVSRKRRLSSTYDGPIGPNDLPAEVVPASRRPSVAPGTPTGLPSAGIGAVAADCMRIASLIDKAACLKKLAGPSAGAGATGAAGGFSGATGGAGAAGGYSGAVGGFSGAMGGFSGATGGAETPGSSSVNSSGRSSQKTSGDTPAPALPQPDLPQEPVDPNRYKISIPESDAGHRVR